MSSKDAVGPTQVNWRVWRQYPRQQLLDTDTNVRAGSKILAGYVRRYGLREGLHAYNGFGDPTSAYPDKVLLVAAGCFGASCGSNRCSREPLDCEGSGRGVFTRAGVQAEERSLFLASTDERS